MLVFVQCLEPRFQRGFFYLLKQNSNDTKFSLFINTFYEKNVEGKFFIFRK